MKIIFLIDSSFSIRDYNRFGFKKLLENGIEVHLWDFYALRNDNFDDHGLLDDSIKNKINYRVFQNYFELVNINLNSFFLIDQRSGIYKEHTLCWFKQKGATTIYIDSGLQPQHAFNRSLLDFLVIIRNNFFNLGLKKTISIIFFYITKQFQTKQKNSLCHDIKVCCGSLSTCKNEEFEIKSHTFDYDIYLKDNVITEKHNQLVFLDTGMAGHPDDEKFNNPAPCKKNIYFPLLRSFFEELESQTGLSVIISIHPRIKITGELITAYGSRKIISGKSNELVKGAKFILAHHTTALNFAILHNIPAIIFTTNEIETKLYEQIKSVSKILKTHRININKDYRGLDFWKIAQNTLPQYDNFKDLLIKTQGSPEKNSAQILSEGLKKYLKNTNK